jgi:hypothetical protein
MRTLGQIPHPEAVISLFSWNGKFIVKFEQGLCEQVFKFEHLDFEDEAEFRAKIDAGFVASVVERFSEMRSIHAKVVG